MTTVPHDRTGTPTAAPAAAPAAHDRVLPPYLMAVALTTGIAWLMLRAMQQSAELDLTGQIETLLPLARLGLVTTPIIVAVRGGIATVTAWLVAGALNDRIALRTVAVGVLTWLPLLELSALVDAVSMLLHPQAQWTASHIPIGLDALMQGGTPRMQLLAQTVNVALLVFTALLARHLTPRVAAGARVAVPSAVAVAVVLVVLPLFRV